MRKGGIDGLSAFGTSGLSDRADSVDGLGEGDFELTH
jgi:hypothetical protein